MQFMHIILILSFGAESFELHPCGLDTYSVYHSKLGVTCYRHEDVGDLPLLDDRSVPANGIFFIDTSCKGGLNVREACSVEAAATVNPDRQVNVLFAGPVSLQCARSEPLTSLLSYTNVRLYRIYPESFSLGTGLEHLLRRAVLSEGPHPALDALDLLKFIAVLKFGGVYMDLDMLATRPLRQLPHAHNWVGIADHAHGMLSAAAFAASTDRVGRKFAQALISVMQDEQAAGVGGFSVVRDAVQRLCGVVPFQKTRRGFSFTCHGLVLYASKFFFPVPCESSKHYFNSSLDISNLTRSFTQQLCNGLTFNRPIPVNSTYHQLMSRYCPKVHGYMASMGLNGNSFNEQNQIFENFIDLSDSKSDDDDDAYTASRGSERARRPGSRASAGAGSMPPAARKWYHQIKATRTRELSLPDFL